LPDDMEARIALLLSNLKSNEVEDVLKRLKASKKVFIRSKKLHFLIHNTPDLHDLRIYRNELGEEVRTHIDLREIIGEDTSLIVKSLQYPIEINCLIDGDWLMEKTGLGPGMKLGRLKDWLFRIQIERGYTEISQIETALCTTSWSHGDPKKWPKPKWP